jgi:hypothetical protein
VVALLETIMETSQRVRCIAAAIVAGSALALSGCYVYSEPVPAGAEVDAGYAPVYYEGNVVYYDDVGEPYVYVGAEVHYVPRTYVSYGYYRDHYRRYRTGYHHWVRSHSHGPMHRRR